MRKGLIKKHQERIKKGSKKLVKLSTLKNLKIAYIPYNELLKEGLVAGIGWAFGVTIGFVIISILLAILLQALGGLPLIGNWFASIVEATQSQLLKRTPIISQ
jgi:hypothetical protein